MECGILVSQNSVELKHLHAEFGEVQDIINYVKVSAGRIWYEA